MTVKETAAFLRQHDNYLILTHKRPDGDTIGCAAALCEGLRALGRTAWICPHTEETHLFTPYLEGRLAPEGYVPETVVSVDIAARSLKTKRTVITKLLDAGLYPYTKRYLGTFDNHFSTIGLIGMNEVGLNAKWLQQDLTHPATQAFAKDVLNHMRARLADYQEQYGDLYNLEATPAESTTYRFAKHDKEQFPDIITANEQGKPYYTNSSHLPVGFTDDIGVLAAAAVMAAGRSRPQQRLP